MQRRTLSIGIVALGFLSIAALVFVSRWEPRVELPDTPPLEASLADAAPADVERRGTPPPPVKFEVDESTDHGALEGRVVDKSTGVPIAEAEITFHHEKAALTVTTNNEGEFRFEPPVSGRYEVGMVNAEGYFPFAPNWGQTPVVFVARAGQRISDIVLELSAARIVIVQVAAPDGAPVPGATVEILGTGSGGSSSLPGKRVFQTDQWGSTPVPAPEGGLLEARREPYAPGRGRVDESAIVSRVLRIQLGPEGSGAAESRSISGRVVYPDGRAVAGAEVYTRTRSRMRPNAETHSKPDGRFGLTGLDAGRYDLRAELPGYAGAVARNVEAGSAGVILTLSEGGRIKGQVMDAGTGAPVPGFKISVAAKIGPIETAGYESKSVYDSEGRYEVTGLSAGTYRVTVMSKGYSFTPPRDVHVPEDSTATVDFSLRQGGRLTGVVVDGKTGEPLARALIALEGEVPLQGAGDEGSDDYRTNSDNSGAFAIEGIPAGSHSIWVIKGDYHRKVQSGIVIVEGQETGPIAVELTPAPRGEEARTELIGIGVVLRARDEFLVVIEVIEGSGAEEVGIVAGDRIQAIEGRTVVALGMGGAIQAMRGEAGTSVNIAVVKKETDELVNLLVPRRRLRT